MLKKIILIVLACSFCFSSISLADEPAKNDPSIEPTVKITVPKSHYVRKALIFPLELPSYAVRIGTWPLGLGLKYMEKYHLIDKTLDFLSNKDKTFWVYPVIEGGAGSGFGGGIGLRHSNLFHKGYMAAGVYKIHINGNQYAAVSFGKPNAYHIFDKPVSYSLGANWNRLLNTNYFGIGNSSSQNSNSDYNIHDIQLGLTMAIEPIRRFNFIPYIGYSPALATNSTNGSVPGIETMFPPAQTQGLAKWMQYFNAGVRITHDTRDNLSYPESGTLTSFTYKYFYCFNVSNYNYNQYEFAFNEYIGLWRPRQVLALHTGWVFESPTGSGNIPFYRLATLDVNSPLRGFVYGRFRDYDYAVFNAEYRFPVWKLIDGVIFYDTGRVFHNVTDFSFSNLKYSVGGGLKFRIPNLLVFRFEAAYGGEGVNFILGASKPL